MKQLSGAQAEAVAADWLSVHGYKLIERNWRNRYVEIDIVCVQKSEIFFVEVKYRKSDLYGSGSSYITQDKSRRLKRAAEMYISSARKTYDGVHISMIEVSGESYLISDFFPDAIMD